jgi:hypothetical protein
MSVTAKDVQENAKKYFNSENLTVGVLIPKWKGNFFYFYPLLYFF